MWKLKIDENGAVVMQDGKPVYVKDDGSEVAIDINQTNATISRLNGEAKSHREAKEAAEAIVKQFEGIDPAKARAAMEVDLSKMVDAGKLDEVKNEVAKSYEMKLKEKDTALSEVSTKYDRMIRSNAFSRSKFIQEKIGVPVDMIEATFGASFKVEDGALRGYMNGNPIYAADRPGEIATFDEALSELVKAYPHRDAILKGSGHSGSGASGGGSGGSGGKATYTRSDFGKLSPMEQSKVAAAARDGKAEIVDG